MQQHNTLFGLAMIAGMMAISAVLFAVLCVVVAPLAAGAAVVALLCGAFAWVTR